MRKSHIILSNIHPTGSYRAYPMLKLPLLQTSSVVYAEALTVFYQSYHFKIRTPYFADVTFPPPPDLPKVLGSKAIRYMTPDLSRVLNLELQDARMAYPKDWDRILFSYVQCLLDHCPQLRFLKLHVNEHPFDRRNSFEQRYHLRKSAPLLAELWKRLDRLEVTGLHRGDTREVTHHGDTREGFRELIAPKHCWIRLCTVELRRFGCSRTTWRTSWLLKRIIKTSNESEQQEAAAI